MILVTTKMSEKSLTTVAMVTKILPLIPKLKTHIPLKKQQKLGTQDLSKFENEKELMSKVQVYYILGS